MKLSSQIFIRIPIVIVIIVSRLDPKADTETGNSVNRLIRESEDLDKRWNLLPVPLLTKAFHDPGVGLALEGLKGCLQDWHRSWQGGRQAEI